MKKTSRKAIAVIISAAMVFTSFAVSAFAADPTAKIDPVEGSGEFAYTINGTFGQVLEESAVPTPADEEFDAGFPMVGIFDSDLALVEAVGNFDFYYARYSVDADDGPCVWFNTGGDQTLSFTPTSLTAGTYKAATYVQDEKINGGKPVIINSSIAEFTYVEEYTVTVDAAIDATQGAVTVSVGEEAAAATAKAKKGDTVTITATPTEGYVVDTVTYTPAGETEAVTVVADAEGAYKFDMPEANVTVSATFKALTEIKVTAFSAADKTVKADAEGNVYSKDNSNLYFDITAEESKDLVITVNGKDVTANYAAGKVPAGTIEGTAIFKEGKYDISVAYKDYPDATPGTATVFVDTTAPEITVTPDLTTTSNVVAGTATDKMGEEAGALDTGAEKVIVKVGDAEKKGELAADGTFSVTLDATLKTTDTVTVTVSDIAGNEGTATPTVTKATLAKPTIKTVDAVEVDQTNAEVYIQKKTESTAGYEVVFDDGENVEPLPAKVFKVSNPADTSATPQKIEVSENKAIIPGSMLPVGPGDLVLTVNYEEYEQTTDITTITVHILDTVTIAPDNEGAVAYDAGKVTGTVTPNSKDVKVTLYKDADCTQAITDAAVTVTADTTEGATAAKWEATLDLTPYINGKIYAKAELSGQPNEAPNAVFAVSEPEAPGYVQVVYTPVAPEGSSETPADVTVLPTEETTGEGDDAVTTVKFYVGKSDSYTVTLKDAKDDDTVPGKEFKANGNSYTVENNVATITGMSAYADATCDMEANYVNGTKIGKATLVIDSKGPEITIDEVTTISTSITGTVSDDQAVDIEKGVTAVVKDKDGVEKITGLTGTITEKTVKDETSGETTKTLTFEIALSALLKEGDVVVVSASDKALNVGSAEKTVTKAPLAAPQILTVAGVEVKDGEVYIQKTNDSAGYAVTFGDSTNVPEEATTPPTLPAKVFTAANKAAAEGTEPTAFTVTNNEATISGSVIPGGSGELELVVHYEGYEETTDITTVIVHILDEVTITPDKADAQTGEGAVEYNAGKVTGTVTPNSSEVVITLYSNEACTETIKDAEGKDIKVNATADTTEGATAAKWEAAVDLTPYINGRIYAKAELSGQPNVEPNAVFAVNEPEAPVFVSVTSADGKAIQPTEETTGEGDEATTVVKFFVKGERPYTIVVKDAKDSDTVPGKEFAVNSNAVNKETPSKAGVTWVDEYTFTIDASCTLADGDNTLTAKYINGTKTATAVLVFDNVAPVVTIDKPAADAPAELTNESTQIVGTITEAQPLESDDEKAAVQITVEKADGTTTTTDVAAEKVTFAAGETTGTYTYTITLDAKYVAGDKVTVSVTDLSGNKGDSNTVTVAAAERADIVLATEYGTEGEGESAIYLSEDDTKIELTVTAEPGKDVKFEVYDDSVTSETPTPVATATATMGTEGDEAGKAAVTITPSPAFAMEQTYTVKASYVDPGYETNPEGKEYNPSFKIKFDNFTIEHPVIDAATLHDRSKEIVITTKPVGKVKEVNVTIGSLTTAIPAVLQTAGEGAEFDTWKLAIDDKIDSSVLNGAGCLKVGTLVKAEAIGQNLSSCDKTDTCEAVPVKYYETTAIKFTPPADTKITFEDGDPAKAFTQVDTKIDVAFTAGIDRLEDLEATVTGGSFTEKTSLTIAAGEKDGEYTALYDNGSAKLETGEYTVVVGYKEAVGKDTADVEAAKPAEAPAETPVEAPAETPVETTVELTSGEGGEESGADTAEATIPVPAVTEIYTIDQEAPEAPVVDEPVTDRDTEITGTAEPGSEVTATVTDADGKETELGPVKADDNGNWTLPLEDAEGKPIALKEGDEVTAVATDPAGNESEASDPIEVEQATSETAGLPALVITGVKVNGTSATISGTKAPGEAATLTIVGDEERVASNNID
ncbi:MAG: hypothetical protein IKD83_04790, partial [Firmicutes bacterium]|nr:hypothetical protein [Bacillota bacterium]